MHRYFITKKEAKRRADAITASKAAAKTEKLRKEKEHLKRQKTNNDWKTEQEKRILNDVNEFYRTLRYYIHQDKDVEEHMKKQTNPTIRKKRREFFLNEMYLSPHTRKFIREILNNTRPLNINIITGKPMKKNKTNIVYEPETETEEERKRGVRLAIAESIIEETDNIDLSALINACIN